MKTTLIVLALAAATPALGETPGERLDRCAVQPVPRDMSAECTALRADFNARVQACLDAPAKASLSQVTKAQAGPSHRTRVRYALCTSQTDQQFRLTGN
jgi:hypothetical protein